MPAIQYDYDDYDYIRSRKSNKTQQTAASTSRATVRNKNSNTIKNSRGNVVRTSKNRPVTKNNNNIKPSEISNTKARNKASIRAVMQDNNIKQTNIKKSEVKKPKEMSLKKAELVGKKREAEKLHVQKRASFIRNFAYCTFGFSVLFLIIYRSSVINESFLELNGMKSKLENTNAVNAQIESEIQTKTDLSNIEMYAKYQLGMQKPKESQIQKVTVAKEDKISTPVIINEEEPSFWDKFLNDFINILD